MTKLESASGLLKVMLSVYQIAKECCCGQEEENNDWLVL